MIRLSVLGVAVLAPGLPGWAASRAVLAGAMPWQDAPLTPPPPMLLPPTERRRTSTAVRLALAVAAEAAETSGMPPESLDTLFASSNGDGQVIGSILEALHETEVAISPTQFHNSVHNAAAGYWGIAVGSARPSVSTGGHDQVFASGLLQAAARVSATGEPLLLCVSDAPLPPPLHAKRPTGCAFGLALVLAPDGAPGAMARLGLAYQPEPTTEPPLPEGLAALRAANASARGLPLLAALAAMQPAELRFGMLEDGALAVEVAPC
ncbi:beta-ketoacyl synthase chain length factor [Plastoroseomonas hellenica]|uniref:beta-ketoacyl synthase chain length factor n=1 Tax=Plastoroseomonas hellenica TaxID=2687306 RepID=UPI001BAC2F2C|nr:beta-ketoacyl synthase chain length factor [Plastoroseomonas hellenica]MBR0644592.1 beta-ketoacyl synthase chain length factor [Plastoroseomonas hellenica]